VAVDVILVAVQRRLTPWSRPRLETRGVTA
jgi:hypothetical protein